MTTQFVHKKRKEKIEDPAKTNKEADTSKYRTK